MPVQVFKDRFEKMQLPDGRSEEEHIWEIIRSWLTILRVVFFVSMIAIAEFMDDTLTMGLPVGIWALIIGIPLFCVLSVVIVIGDRNIDRIKKCERTEELRGKIIKNFGRDEQLLTPGRDAGKEDIRLYPITDRR